MARTTSDGKLVDRSPKEPERPKPSFRVSEDDLPDIKKWTVGKKYKVHAHVEMRTHSKGDRYGFDETGSKKKHEADLVVHKIEPAEEEE